MCPGSFCYFLSLSLRSVVFQVPPALPIAGGILESAFPNKGARRTWFFNNNIKNTIRSHHDMERKNCK